MKVLDIIPYNDHELIICGGDDISNNINCSQIIIDGKAINVLEYDVTRNLFGNRMAIFQVDKLDKRVAIGNDVIVIMNTKDKRKERGCNE